MSALPVTRNAARRRQANKGAKGQHKCGRLWYAARVLRRFTASDLMAVAEVDTRNATLAWLNKMRHAGYFRNTVPKSGEGVWTLIRDTGPRCPAILLNRTVIWDFNTETAHVMNAPQYQGEQL